MSNYAFLPGMPTPFWSPNSTVYWYFSGPPQYLGDIAGAFWRWDQQLSLDFVQTSSPSQADVTISFENIDGQFGLVGHVWGGNWPGSITGDAPIVFDSSDTWTWSPVTGHYVLNGGPETLYEVALHEIGHAIGLAHPTNDSMLMYESVDGSATDLTYWDIYAAQSIYGPEFSQPDLDVFYTPVISATPVPAGNTVTISYEVDNDGVAWAGPSISGIYLSLDSTITVADTLLATDAVPAIAAGGWSPESVTFAIPTTLAPGTYYLGVIADHSSAIVESNETNNPSVGIAISVSAPVQQPDFNLVAQSAYFKMTSLSASPAQVTSLAQFASMQYAYGQQIGVVDPAIYMWQSFGHALCEGSNYFRNGFGPAALQTEAVFATAAYETAFGVTPGQVQVNHFVAQVDYFEAIYTASGAYGTDVAKIGLLARGAVYGQMLGFADELGFLT